GAGTAGTAFARPGGLAASDLASNVGSEGLTFLQSPSEGQLMVVPTRHAVPLDGAALEGSLVDAQMDGRPVGDAMSGALEEKGYLVYRRPAGDFWGELVRVATKTAGAHA
ncbi:MAG: hypothetical protein HY908_20000, partial [Myxococcales bacterium]|nr:hypothetical protein [Myxococcales bacterium]